MTISPYAQPETINAAIQAAFAVGGAESAPAPALSEAQRHRLVKAAKCPTRRENAELQAKHPFLVESFGIDRLKKQLKQRTSTKMNVVRWIAENLSEQPTLHTVTNREGLPVLTVGSIDQRAPDTLTLNGTRTDFAHLIKTGELKPASHRVDRGVFAVISRRQWSGEWRLRTQCETAHGLPPEQAGARYTDTLSLSGARKLADSCHYMALQKGGYSTFLTLTLDEAGRSRVADRRAAGPCTEIVWEKGRPAPLVTWLHRSEHETEAPDIGPDLTWGSLQQEASRFFDALNKMYQRGWLNSDTGTHHAPSRVIGWKGAMVGTEGKAPKPKGAVIREGLHYCWVAECPKNERGHDNPHLHVLMRWRVPFKEFTGWAARLESLWGQGFAHLEKIKEPEKAGAYMAKAAGYLTKAQGATDQGVIRGNRYAISKPSRAPEWECVGRFNAGIMGSLIADAHDYFTHLYGHHFNERRELNEALATEPKGTQRRHQIGQKLEKVRAALAKLPAVISKYQITFKSGSAASEFLAWARDDSGAKVADWLPVKDAGEAWSDAAAIKPQTAWGKRWAKRQAAKQHHKDEAERKRAEWLAEERAFCLENKYRRQWERRTGGTNWWQSCCDWFNRWELVDQTKTDARWERDNWGYV